MIYRAIVAVLIAWCVTVGLYLYPKQQPSPKPEKYTPCLHRTAVVDGCPMTRINCVSVGYDWYCEVPGYDKMRRARVVLNLSDTE